MNDEEIEIISSSADLNEVGKVLKDFLKNNENVFTFPLLYEENRRVILWTALFQRLQQESSEKIHDLCLAVIRILSRDKTELDSLVCEKWITTLIERGGLYNFVSVEDETNSPLDMPNKEIVVEALKCLCNIAFNSEVARALCAHTSIDQALIGRLRVYKDIPFKEEVMLYDMKLLFILTALRQDIKKKIKDVLHGMDYLISGLNELLLEATLPETEANASACAIDEQSHYLLQDSHQGIACEILKTQFNLIIHSGSDEPVDEEEEAMYLKLMPVLAALLCAQATSEAKLMELHINIANLLTSVPPMFYSYLTPELTVGEVCQHEFEGRNMDALEALVQLLHHRLESTAGTKNQYEDLSPILTVMVKSARGCRAQRKWLRGRVLPPLRDVSRPPERGRTTRNQLCRLLTTPVTAVRDLVAEFLFVLCKEKGRTTRNQLCRLLTTPVTAVGDLVAEFLFVLCKEKVGRMVKYTGFGNAAGHLAQKGLLGGGRGAQYSSSSDDSDTEEYLEAAPHIDPVVGCTRPPRADPFEGMTEEQKEYEAMKLVNLFDRMVSEGVVKPARVGPDGRPQPIEHVMEFREHVPNRPQS